MHYYKRHIGDYRAATAHLTLLEHGVYSILIDLYYMDEKPFPLETQSVYRRLRAVTEDERAAVDAVLSDFFVKGEDGYRHKRIDSELAGYQANAEKNRENGGKGGRPKKADAKQKKTQSVSDGNQPESQGEPKHNLNQEPLTNNQETINHSLSPTPHGENETTTSKNAEAPQAARESKSVSQAGLFADEPADAQQVAPTQKPSASEAMFEQAWAAYPKRAGGNSRADALKAWKARVTAGVLPADMLAGVKRYAAYCEAKGNIGTEYVKQAATFFGPSKHFDEAWDIPAQQQRTQGGGFMTARERQNAIDEANMRAFLEGEGFSADQSAAALPPPNDPMTIDME
ncbi:DUF1376 domain-containing protein [Paraburkholderia sp. A1RO-5L]|uniref:YdaU family protein n=1 Tax=Paraburkholderia sp. A1RO-5L TaxID=3028370 RepID=UPI003B7E0081